ncbi:hypothetical protein MKW94_021249 [Papaver nudicaule]|uniref:Gamma-glutamyl transferase n=1 Tax=Papaver nudicaule TaxID=74823 RepID=A0AA41V9E1_PAPNU|nr:hypothetical protein [Papaver nudicaule]
MSSGIGGGAFMVVRNAAYSEARAFNFRETAPSAASEGMYERHPANKSKGALSMGVPGEIAGLHSAWLMFGKLEWYDLFQPAIKYARDGFVVSPFLGLGINKSRVFMREGRLLRTGELCYNPKLAETLQLIAKGGCQAFYNGAVGKNLVKDVQAAGGILTEEDLRNYRVDVTDVVTAKVMNFTILGMPPPSSGILGLTLVLNILNSYESLDFLKGPLGLHRLIEALKHMLAYRMHLGDPKFVKDIKKYQASMLSPSFAARLRKKICDNTTFPSDYYIPKLSQLNDHGTSHLSIVDKDRNAVSMTATINHYFGAGVLSPSTGIILNNQMDDFSAPFERFIKKRFPPAKANYIEPNKRPLSSMSPLIILDKEEELVGVLGASGGINIIPAVTQVFLNHFIKKMEPLPAVKEPRVYHKQHIELSPDKRSFLRERHHILEGTAAGAICQLVVQDEHGKLTAVSDPRKGGRPAAV